MIQASRSIGCSNCGGTTTCIPGQDYYRCEFCSSLMRTTDVSLDRILPTGMSADGGCPVCSGSLQTGSIEGRTAMYCGNCFGVLLRHADFGGIIQERQARRAGIDPAEPRPIDSAAFERRLNCPVCSGKMDVHPYYGPGNIVVDTCAPCGYLWLDHGELTRVEQSTRNVRAVEFAAATVSVSESTDDPPQPGNKSPLQVLADLLF